MSEQTLSPTEVVSAMSVVIQAKAEQDAAFRAEVVANPRAAVEKLFETELPAHIKLQVVEPEADTYVIVLPKAPAVGKDGELSDDDLEAVAGGSKSGATNFFNKVGNGFKGFGSAVGGMGVTLGQGVSGHKVTKAEYRNNLLHTC